MNIIFTLCSNNYLSQAKVLTDSVHYYNPNEKVIIGLVDELSPEVDYSFIETAEIIPVTSLKIPRLPELCSRYNIVELNTALKASYIKYLIAQYPNAKNIIYFDPDIRLYSSLLPIYQKLEKMNILLTPHILSPTPHDGLTPQENCFLNYGIYNLGFIALKTCSDEVIKFLDWWEHCIINFGYNRVADGFFVDQLWVNLVPVFYKNVQILQGPEFNMAPWNLHERYISKKERIYFVNDAVALIFYHFSSFDYRQPEILCKPFYSRYTFKTRPDLQILYEEYYSELIKNKVFHFSKISCALLPPNEEITYDASLNEKINFWLRQIKPPLFNRFFKN